MVLLAVGVRVVRFSVCGRASFFLAFFVSAQAINRISPQQGGASPRIPGPMPPKSPCREERGGVMEATHPAEFLSVSYMCEIILLARARARCGGAARAGKRVMSPLFNVCFTQPDTSLVDNCRASIRPILSRAADFHRICRRRRGIAE